MQLRCCRVEQEAQKAKSPVMVAIWLFKIFFIKQCRSRCFLALFFNIHSSLHCIASSFSCHCSLLPVNPYYFSVATFVLLVSMLLTEIFFLCDICLSIIDILILIDKFFVYCR